MADDVTRSYDPNSPEMLDARIGALRYLVIEILERNPAMIDEIRAKIDAPYKMPKAGWWERQRSIMHGILTRAKYPHGPPEPSGGWPED